MDRHASGTLPVLNLRACAVCILLACPRVPDANAHTVMHVLLCCALSLSLSLSLPVADLLPSLVLVGSKLLVLGPRVRKAPFYFFWVEA